MTNKNRFLPQTLENLLQKDCDVDSSYFASFEIQKKRKESVKGKKLPNGRSIWHENKSGNISPLPYSCALRAGASYNYLLVDGVRRLTPRECERLMGWPDDHTRWDSDDNEITDGHRYRMCGNGVVSSVAKWVGEQVMRADDQT